MVTSMIEKGRGMLNRTDSNEVLNDLSQAFPTGRMWIPRSSEERLQFMLNVKARYGSDTAGMVERTLSEFMETASRIPNISDRRKSAMNFLPKLRELDLNKRDETILAVTLLNQIDNPRIEWEVEVLPSGIIRIRSSFT